MNHDNLQLDPHAAGSDQLGFIGLGLMGSRLAKRLLGSGYSVVVFDRDRDKEKELVSHGATKVGNVRELSTRANVILSCLADPAAVRSVYLEVGGVLANAKRGTRVIEMSTVAPDTSQQLYRAAQDLGVSVTDVSISGSTPAAENGALTLFGGGDRSTFDAAAPIFSKIARQWFYMGPSGSGTAMKLVVNTLLGVGMQAIAEALALGRRLGLPREQLFDTLAKTAVVAPAHLGKIAAAKDNDYSAQFPVRLMHKDFDLILSKAAELGVTMPVTEEASKLTELETAYGREEDFSAVIRLMEQLADTRTARPPAASRA